MMHSADVSRKETDQMKHVSHVGSIEKKRIALHAKHLNMF